MFRIAINSTNFLKNLRKLSTSTRLDSNSLFFTFASPGQVFYKEKVVKQVDVPSLTGSFGIVAQHVPTLSCLKPGIVSVTEEDGTLKKYFVSSGTVTVNDDSSVQILAEEAVTLDMLDHTYIREGLTKAQSDYTSSNTEETKAESQIALECWDALNKAIDSK